MPLSRAAAIARNTFLQTARQPLYGIILLLTLGGMALAPPITGWTLDDDNKMLRDIGLSTLLIQGMFLACLGASSVIHAEIEDRTALTVVAKPVGRGTFLLGKYLGVLAALLLAHYLAGIAYFMAMRHGVLQSAAEQPDMTVIILGPGLMAVLVIVAAVLNYVYEWRFLATLLALAVPVLTLSAAVLLVLDRDWKLNGYLHMQIIDSLPAAASDPAKLRGIIAFQPEPGELPLAGHKGLLVRSKWRGPISDEEQTDLLDLSDSVAWKKAINFLADTTRKAQGTEVFKAALLLVPALLLMAAFAVAASTRLGAFATFLVCLIAVAAGLSADQVLKPMADAGTHWAAAAYRVIPNFQCFWMIDPLSEEFIIPWGYVVSAAGYAVIYAAAVLALGMALFETREVG